MIPQQDWFISITVTTLTLLTNAKADKIFTVNGQIAPEKVLPVATNSSA